MKENTQKLEKKIKSINKILKISRAMKIISSMNIKKIQQKIKENSFILKELKKILNIIFYFKKSKEIFNFLDEKKESKKITRIIFSSDLGLCGGYNNDLFKYVLDVLKPNDDLIIIGKKGINFFNYYNKKIIWSEILEKFNWDKIKELLNFILKDFNETKINIVYVGIEEKNKIKIKETQVFPFNNDVDKELGNCEFDFYKIEPSVEVIYENSVNFYFEFLLLKIKDEAKYTEELNRRSAMEGASENAKDMIFDLKLKYNQLRQEKITKEIINISQNE